MDWGITGCKQRKRSSSSDSRSADGERDNTVAMVLPRYRHVVVTVVVMVLPWEMGQISCRQAPPGPWSDRALGPGWGSGLWSRRTGAPAPRSWRTGQRGTEAGTAPWDRCSLWSRRDVSSWGGLSWRSPTSLATVKKTKKGNDLSETIYCSPALAETRQ